MKRLLLTLALLLAGFAGARGQFGSFGDVPIEINSEETRFEGGIAIADRNVIIRYSDVTIYCDYATYNPDTRDVLLTGNVRIYRQGQLFTGDRALYNLETKVLNAADFSGDFGPFRFGGNTLSSLGGNAYLVKEGIFTTSDSSKPDWQLRARTARIYAKDRVIFTNVRLYVGRTPVFWFPYLYQSLDREQAFTISPGYSNVWGAYLHGQYTFPLAEQTSGKFRLDYYSQRGWGIGFDARWPAGSDTPERRNSATETLSDAATDEKKEEGKHGRNWGRFRSYYINDANPGTNTTGNLREPINPDRYRVSLQDRTYLTEDIYSSININLLSDRRFLQDFFPTEFRLDPNPDNFIAVTKWDENYAFNLIARTQLNSDQDSTERLPEGALDIKRLPVFGKSGLFYDSNTSAGYLRRYYATNSIFPNYESFRADTFHQLTYPMEFGGWLSVVPHAGVRGTYYTDGGFTEQVNILSQGQTTVIDPETGLPIQKQFTFITTGEELHKEGSLFRTALNAGLESSFKFSRAFEQVQSRMWGLDGLRHVVQPFMDFSYVWTDVDPARVLQFDTLRRSTQLSPIDFPQFNTSDSIDNWAILRLGVRNRLQTRRDNYTATWFEMSTYFDINLERPTFGLPVTPDSGTFSNVVTQLRWNPLPWVNLLHDSQFPIFDHGFTQVNTSINFLPTRNTQLSISQRYMNGNPLFIDSNLLGFSAYTRLGENWGFSYSVAYEFQDSLLEGQRYVLYRDLSSMVASVGVAVLNNNGTLGKKTEYGVLLTFTLKDIPGVGLPLSFDPSSLGAGTGKSR